jgi:hypothetical protein
MLATLSQEQREEIGAFYQAAFNNPKAVALREEFRPLIREQMQQAHEKTAGANARTLDSVAKAHPSGMAPTQRGPAKTRIHLREYFDDDDS